VRDGVEKFGRYFRRKGWLGDEGGRRDTGWKVGEGGVRIVLEVATAWAVTKALLPLRLLVSVWGTPWFARVFILPVTNWTARRFGRAGKTGTTTTTAATAAGGTGAVSGGAVPKSMERAGRGRSSNEGITKP